MKYDIKFSCGHEETIELFGNGKERERKIAYYEEYGVCSECYRKHLEDVAKHNADFCNDQGLVITIGSSAQVREAYISSQSLIEQLRKPRNLHQSTPKKLKERRRTSTTVLQSKHWLQQKQKLIFGLIISM